MRGFWNFIWHIPFCGFLLSLLYALSGVLLCCTIILLPVGLKYFEIAKYLLAPFSHALVTEKELSMITGEKAEMGIYSTILRILYFPFGCLAAVVAIGTMVGQFITLLGIPCALVWGRMLSSIFNPFNKVCVPKDVADEIERMHSAQTVGKYSAVPSQASAVIAPSSAVQESLRGRVNAATPRSFSDEKLKEITDTPEMYNSDLVQQCRHEMEIRSTSAVLMAQVRDFSDEKINEILADTVTYSEGLVYCCSVEKDAREAKAREYARLKAEEERRRREEEERVEMERRIAWWKKWWWVVAVGVVAIISFLCVNGYIQTKKEQERIAEMRRIERERFVADSIEQVRIAEEQEKLEKERAKVAAEQARLKRERAEKERKEREEQERMRKEREEQEKLQRARVERERFVADSIERARIAEERAQERARAEKERRARHEKAMAAAARETREAKNKITDFIRAYGGEVKFKTRGTAITKSGYTTFVVRLVDSDNVSVGVEGNTGNTTFKNPTLKMRVDGYELRGHGSGYKSFSLLFKFSGNDVKISASYQVNAGYDYFGVVTLPAR